MHKWTAGEVRRIVAEGDGDAALEVLKYLVERETGVVAWDDESDPEVESEARRDAELRASDAADGIL